MQQANRQSYNIGAEAASALTSTCLSLCNYAVSDASHRAMIRSLGLDPDYVGIIVALCPAAANTTGSGVGQAFDFEEGELACFEQ